MKQSQFHRAVWLAAAFMQICIPAATRAQQTPAPTSAPATAAAASDEPLAAARELMQKGDLDKAILTLNGISAAHPQTPGLEALLGKAYYEKQAYMPAVNHLQAALKANPSDAESMQILGISYYLLGHLQQAIPLLQKVQTALPNPDVTGFYILGVSYMQTRDFDNARVEFARMFSVPPDSAAAHLFLAKMMMRQQFEDQAGPELRKALQLDPRLPMAHFILGEIALFKSNIQEALNEFQQELNLNPMMWLAYWRMGDAYTRVQNWDAAERSLKQAIELDETFTGPFILMGKVEMKKGDLPLAASYLKHALQMDPNNYLAHYQLGTIYKQMGLADQANHEFELTRTLRANKGP